MESNNEMKMEITKNIVYLKEEANDKEEEMNSVFI
jgi:hypothetical protein